jgi:hypothetical protein
MSWGSSSLQCQAVIEKRESISSLLPLSLQAYIETKRDHADAGSSRRQLCMGEVEHPKGEK